MQERHYEHKDKIYIGVKAVFLPDGTLKPLSILWEDGREFTIDRVLDIRRAASLKAGGTGVRYTCRVMNRQVYIFAEDDGRWFVERPN